MVALTKFGAAWWTGSSAMLSEALHSLVDTSNQLLLLYGIYRADRPPDESRPFGHGRELYFWSFVVSILMFALGAGAALYEGVSHIRHPAEIVDPIVSYVVLGLSFVFEFSTWIVALRHFRESKGDQGYYEAVRRSKDPTSFMVLFEDSAALAGLVIAFAGTYAASTFGMPALDGVAAIGISMVLGVTAFILARESKELLIGEPATRAVADSILKLAAAADGIERANGLFTTHLGPDDIIASLSVEFCDDMTAPQIEQAVIELERQIKAAHPSVTALFIKPQTTSTYRRRRETAVAM
jgi:cation diffusion facilitator family transporter